MSTHNPWRGSSSISGATGTVLSAPWDGKRFTLRDDARRFETSEVSLALLAGLANALEEYNASARFPFASASNN